MRLPVYQKRAWIFLFGSLPRDAGNTPPVNNANNYTLTGWRVVAGPPGTEIGSDDYAESGFNSRIEMRPGRDGFHIRCAHCHREFESKGLRCCSTECERGLKEHRDNLATLAEAGIEVAAKRTCLSCGGRIPQWRKGRKVSAATRFCSAKCGQKYRNAQNAV
jgi:hypothetical protein